MPDANLSMFVKRVNASITSTAVFEAGWIPSPGKRIYWKGCALRAFVTTTLAGMTPGGSIYLGDDSANFFPLGTIKTATDPAGTDYGHIFFNCTVGDPLYTTNATLRLTVRPTMTGGVIQVVGFVWGDELPGAT
jgi:hypothetical protein